MNNHKLSQKLCQAQSGYYSKVLYILQQANTISKLGFTKKSLMKQTGCSYRTITEILQRLKAEGAISYRATNNKWQLIDKPIIKPKNCQQAILMLMEQSLRGFTARDLAKKLGYSLTTIKESLTALRAQCYVLYRSNGEWTLNEVSQEVRPLYKFTKDVKSANQFHFSVKNEGVGDEDVYYGEARDKRQPKKLVIYDWQYERLRRINGS